MENLLATSICLNFLMFLFIYNEIKLRNFYKERYLWWKDQHGYIRKDYIALIREIFSALPGKKKCKTCNHENNYNIAYCENCKCQIE